MGPPSKGHHLRLSLTTLLPLSGSPEHTFPLKALSLAHRAAGPERGHIPSLKVYEATSPQPQGHSQRTVWTSQMLTDSSTRFLRQAKTDSPSWVGAGEANTKAHLVAEAVPRGTTLFQ